MIEYISNNWGMFITWGFICALMSENIRIRGRLNRLTDCVTNIQKQLMKLVEYNLKKEGRHDNIIYVTNIQKQLMKLVEYNLKKEGRHDR